MRKCECAPSHILERAGLIRTGYYKEDLFYGINLKNVDNSSFLVPWYVEIQLASTHSRRVLNRHYRTDFTLAAADAGKTVIVTFKGISYRANAFINGIAIAKSQDMAGRRKSPLRAI